MSELQDLSALIRANTLIVIETQDEGRIVELFRQTLMHVAGPAPLVHHRGPAPHRPGPRGRGGRPPMPALRCR